MTRHVLSPACEAGDLPLPGKTRQASPDGVMPTATGTSVIETIGHAKPAPLKAPSSAPLAVAAASHRNVALLETMFAHTGGRSLSKQSVAKH